MNEFARHLIQHLFEDHHADLHAMLSRRLGCTHIAADVAQDSYMRVMEVQEPEEIRHPRAFLFRIARNLAANARRVRSSTRAMAHAHEHELYIASEVVASVAQAGEVGAQEPEHTGSM